jgi:hypothetical protein
LIYWPVCDADTAYREILVGQEGHDSIPGACLACVWLMHSVCRGTRVFERDKLNST